MPSGLTWSVKHDFGGLGVIDGEQSLKHPLALHRISIFDRQLCAWPVRVRSDATLRDSEEDQSE